MDVYFSPMTCSLATRIALYEADLPATFHEVSLQSKRLPDGSDFHAVNPKGQVPTLRTTKGDVLTENAAVLEHLAALSGATGPAASGDPLREQLAYVASEIHKAIYYPIFHPASPPEVKSFARDVILPTRYAYLSKRLADREFLLEAYSVADGYLFTTLCWAETAGVDMSAWPVLVAYRKRVGTRPAVARAVAEERALRAKG